MALQGYNAYTYNNLFKRGEFHHVVLSVSGNIHTLYLDGSMVAQNRNSGDVFASYPFITNTIIGANSSLNNAFKGNIDDVRVYNKALLPTQVSDLYINRNLVIYYPFDNLVNKQTPNYATLQYDASFIGQSSITTNAVNGNGALSVSNTQGVAATQYVYSKPYAWYQNANIGLTIGCWINTTGIPNRIQRIFDIITSSGPQGLAVDISGTNMIYSGYSPFYFYENFNTVVSSTYGTTSSVNGTLFSMASGASISNVTFNTGKSIWTWNGSNYYGLYVFSRSLGGDASYWINNQQKFLTDVNANILFVQTTTLSQLFSVSTTLNLPAGNYKVSVAMIQSTRNTFYYCDVKIALGASSITLNNVNTTYGTVGSVNIDNAYSIYSSNGTNTVTTVPSSVMQNNDAINYMRSGSSSTSGENSRLCYLTLNFNNITSGLNVLSFSNTKANTDGFAISQVIVKQVS